MKKILSLTLAALMVVSMIPTAFAAETQDYSLGTAVTVEGAGGEYTVTVPATLIPGQVGTVTAKGYWPKEEKLSVTAPKTIEVTNTETNQKATVNVAFDGISSLGDDLEELTKTADISVDKGNTKFGTWSGVITYTVNLRDVSELASFTVKGIDQTLYTENGMTWAEWIASDLNTVGITSKTTYATIVVNSEGKALTESGSAPIEVTASIIANKNYSLMP